MVALDAVAASAGILILLRDLHPRAFIPDIPASAMLAMPSIHLEMIDFFKYRCLDYRAYWQGFVLCRAGRFETANDGGTAPVEIEADGNCLEAKIFSSSYFKCSE